MCLSSNILRRWLCYNLNDESKARIATGAFSGSGVRQNWMAMSEPEAGSGLGRSFIWLDLRRFAVEQLHFGPGVSRQSFSSRQ